jgi:L-asparaginase
MIVLNFASNSKDKAGAYMKKILVITTGGTIAMAEDDKGTVQVQTENVLLQWQHLFPSEAQVTFRPFRNKPSVHLNRQDYRELLDLLTQEATRFDGFVITHGTDLLEETAYFLDLTFTQAARIPVVLTGAMRSSNEVSSDGPYNLLSAVRVAAHEDSAGKGVLVALNGEIHAARYVQKMHTSAVDAFRSPGMGPLGFVRKSGVHYVFQALCRDSLSLDGELAKVGIVKAAFAEGADLIDFMISQGYQGIVIEGVGLGHVPPEMVGGIERAITRGIPVVMTSRSPEGITAPVYGYTGGGKDLLERGVIFTNGYPAQKARIKLMVFLASQPQPTRKQLAELFR